MKYAVTEYDKNLLLQQNLFYKLKIQVTDLSRNILDEFTGISDTGGITVDTGSDIRRTFSFTLHLDNFVSDIEEKLSGWIGYYYDVFIGLYDYRNNEFVYYENGRYRITDASTSYSATANSIIFNLSDRVAELDGTRNGQIGGASVISVPQEVNGVKQTIRGVTVAIVESSTLIDKYIIDDIGEFYGMPQNNDDYEAYREANEDWNVLPYDLEYDAGTCISQILFDIRDLYPNCQMYFDVYDNFCFNMIPSLDNDLPDLDTDYIEQILLSDNSENVFYDVSSIKNVTEVFGKTYDIDRYAEESVYKEDDDDESYNYYYIELENYEGYSRYDMIAFMPSADNGVNPYFQINGLAKIPIYKEYTDEFVSTGTIKADVMCVLEIYKASGEFVAYYLGEYQPHALCVLTGNTNDETYTPAYFSEKYNVDEDAVIFREEPFSPFTVQRLGEILDVKSGNDFDNIISKSVAMDNARYYNRSTSTMFDTVTITTKLIPWLDVNVKVNYRKCQEDTAYSYIVTKRADNFADGTSSITMYRFMQLYE